MRQGKYLGLNLPDYTDAADVQKLVENFEKLEERAPGWTNLSNSGTVLETGGSFQVAPLFPVGDAGIFAITLENFEKLEERAPGWTNLSNSGTVLETGGSFQVAPLFPVGDAGIFAITLKMPRAFVEGAPGWTNLSNSGTVLETGGSFQVAPLFPVGDAGIFAITLKMPRAFVEGDVVMVEDTAYNLYQGTDPAFQVAPLFPVGDAGIFAITLKMPRAFVEGDVVMVEDTAYNLYQGTDPALNDAWKAGEVVTINFDKISRRCWASAGGGAPRPLPAQVSNMQASTPEGETPSIVFTWTNPSFDKISRRCWASAGGGAPRPLPAQVSNMQASTPEGETPSIVFTWTNPSDENFAGMVLIVKEGSAPNSVTDGVQVYKGTGTTFTYTEDVQWEHTYFARGFAYNSQNKFQLDATGAIASATPSDVPNPVSGLKLEGNKGNATLTWTNPTQQSLQEVRVIQKIDSAPANPNDGTQVYSGTGISCTVSNLQDSIHYYFAVYAIAKNGTVSIIILLSMRLPKMENTKNQL